MGATHEDGDARSPKRQAQTSVLVPCNSAARAVAALDAAIWTSIVEFLPIPKEINMVEKERAVVDWDAPIRLYKAAVSEVVTTWRTILNLRLVTKELAALLHPVDSKALWKRLLLQSFDFSVGGFTINAKIYKEDHRMQIPSDEVEDEGEQNPQVVAMRGRYFNMPPNYLEEDLVNWHKLGIFHRPSQYGFLTTLQQQPPVGTWPETEDPFTLFSDLVRLLMLPHGDNMVAGGESSEPMSKFIAAPTEADANSDYFRFNVMKTLGYVPHFWHWGSGVSDAWKGFTDPEAFEVAISKHFDKEENDDYTEEEKNDQGFDDADRFNFPSCSVGDAKHLYPQLHQHCKDWRAACCNSGSDGITPVFNVGESKAAPHRWIGYATTMCWS